MVDQAMTAGNQPLSSGSKTVRHALHDLADNIRSKVVQLTHYRDHGCQLDHARVIAEGRIAQANQILHWIDESIAKVSGAPAQGAPDQRLTEDMTLAHNARKAAIEECKRLIEESQETFSETHEGSRRHLTPRKHGNSAGLAYADGIGALSAVTPSPGPGDVAIPDYDSAARALGFRQISEGGKWWAPDPLWHPSYLGRWDTAEDIFKSWGPSAPSTNRGGGK